MNVSCPYIFPFMSDCAAGRKRILARGQRAALPPYTTPLLQNGYDIRTIQEFLGHKDVKTTMIYTHVLQCGGMAVKSPLEG